MLSIVLIVLVSIPIKTIQLRNYGIYVHKYKKTVEHGVIYQPGKHFIGYVGYFKTFPKDWIQLTFDDTKLENKSPNIYDRFMSSIRANIKDSAPIEIHCIVMYKFIPAKLHELLTKWFEIDKHTENVISISKVS